ncbi:MAG: adenosylmethionine decarboxylase [Bacteroidetes bacterium]|nr:adenosylmethionine decarboxylase [Bacteroidota bacterium]
MLIKNKGLHIIADFYDCDFSALKNMSKNDLEHWLNDVVKKSGFEVLGVILHYFNIPTSFTALICIAESHISIHTWPEIGYVSIDVFVCNFKRSYDNEAKNIYSELSNFFSPQKIVEQTIIR